MWPQDLHKYKRRFFQIKSMSVNLVLLIILIVCLLCNHQAHSLDIVTGGGDSELGISRSHHARFKKQKRNEKKRSSKVFEREQKNVDLLKDIVKDSDRFNLLKYQGNVLLRCEWERDLKMHDGSCARFLFVEAGISVNNASTSKLDCVEIDFLSNHNDFSIFLSQLELVLPMEWFVPVHLYDVRGPKRTGRDMKKSNDFKYPPRYVVANLQFPPRQGTNSADASTTTLDTTLDLGNSKRTILMVDDCRGCANKENPKNGCPDIVPTCEIENGVNDGKRKTAGLCWKSNPNQSVPSHSFKYTKDACSNQNFYNKEVLDAPICRQCFQNGQHSRYVAKAKMKKFSITRATVRATRYSRYNKDIIRFNRFSPAISNFNFGALIRTVPLVDRIWSNVGIGAGSDFLTQLNATRLMIDFNYYTANKNNTVVFNPNPESYKDWEYARYQLNPISENRFKRVHSVHGFYFGHKSIKRQKEIASKSSSKTHSFRKKVHFHIDTGNDGISIADEDLHHFLARATGGQWIHGTLYTPFSPDTAPELNIDMSLGKHVFVTIPGSVWSLPKLSSEDMEEIRSTSTLHYEEFPSPLYTQTFVSHESPRAPGYPTIFSQYHKDVLGLPFLSLPGFTYVFDDKSRALFIGKNKVYTIH